LKTAKGIAEALGMGLEEFLKALEEHVSVKRRYQVALTSQKSIGRPV
jgi:hypothetical protein